MTAPLFLVPPGRLAGAGPGVRLLLDGDEGRHAATVRRLRPGEPVDLADGSGTLGRGAVVATGTCTLEVELSAVESLPPPEPALVLVQALAKGGRDEQAVQAATEVGVDVVLPWQASRSVVRWAGARGGRSRQRWVATAREAAKQSRRARVPEVGPALDTRALLDRVTGAALTLLLEAGADAALTTVPLVAAGELLVVVGPEGGIAAEEAAALRSAGAVAVRLGPEVLRASTAGPVALAVLAARLRRWG